MTKKIKKENKLEELERRIKFLEENSISKFGLIPVVAPPVYLPYSPQVYRCGICGSSSCPGYHITC